MFKVNKIILSTLFVFSLNAIGFNSHMFCIGADKISNPAGLDYETVDDCRHWSYDVIRYLDREGRSGRLDIDKTWLQGVHIRFDVLKWGESASRYTEKELSDFKRFLEALSGCLEELWGVPKHESIAREGYFSLMDAKTVAEYLYSALLGNDVDVQVVTESRFKNPFRGLFVRKAREDRI
ncbi:hypothetical protein KAW80_04020 [Candidatus Babeliales bacterium]|nr:hypothetical protein [Candidatus Babeliales bacterium]